MSNFLIAILCCFSIIDWVRIEDRENGFELMMPFSPTSKSDSLDSDIGRIYTRTLTCSEDVAGETNIFLANFTRYPIDLDLLDKDSTGYYLCETIINQVSSQLNRSTVIYKTNTEMNGQPAMIAQIRYDDSSQVRIAMIMHSNSMMSLQYYSAYRIGMGRDAEKFFNSYRTLK